MNEQPIGNRGEIIIYRAEDNTVQLDVRMENETVWLTASQMAELFGRDVKTIRKHINNALHEELAGEVVGAKFASTTQHGAMEGKTQTNEVMFYNLEMITSIGFRVKSKRGIQFRKWANRVLKDYMLRGYVVNQRLLNIENQLVSQQKQLAQHQEQIDFFVRTSLPPVEGIFYDGQIFDAYTFVNDRIREAKKRIVLIDNYVDDSVLKINEI